MDPSDVYPSLILSLALLLLPRIGFVKCLFCAFSVGDPCCYLLQKPQLEVFISIYVYMYICIYIYIYTYIYGPMGLVRTASPETRYGTILQASN